MSPRAQATVVSHVPTEVVAPAPTTPAGSGSVTATERASEGPVLVTVIVHEIGPPATAFAGPVFVNVSAAVDVNVAVVSAASSPGCPSVVSLLTVARLVRSAPA